MLFATPGLKDYFVSEEYKEHINLYTPSGSKGEVVNSFSKVLRAHSEKNGLEMQMKKFKAVIDTYLRQCMKI